MYRHARSSIVTPALGCRAPFVGLIAPAALIAIVANPLTAGTVATWSSAASTGAWASISNWNGLVVPGATAGTTNSDTAVFNSASTTTAIVPDPNRNLQNITFDGSASAYTIGTAGGNALLMTSGGTIQIAGTFTGAAFETINAPMVLEGNYTLANNSLNVRELEIVGTISGGAAGTQTLTIGGIGTVTTGTIGGGIGNIAVIKNGSGEAILNGNDTFTGGVTINAGAVITNTAGAFNSTSPNSVTFGFGSTGVLELFGTTITVSGLSSNGGTPVVENGSGGVGSTPATLIVTNSVANNYGGALTDGFNSARLSLVKSGFGTLTLSGTSTYTGSTTIDNFAFLQGGATNALSAASAFNVLAGGTLNLGGYSQSIGSLAGGGLVTTTGSSGSDTLTVGSDNTNSTFSGVISDAFVGGRTVALTKIGSGTFTLTGNNTFTGPLIINGGTLALGGGTLASNVTNSATFVYNAGSFSGRLTNMGTANFNGAFTAGNGMENDGTASNAAGADVTLNGAGLNNQGSLSMTGGILTVSSSAPSATNFNGGSLSLVSPARVNLPGAVLVNTGTLSLDGGAISGAGGTVINGGMIFGTGTISAAFVNNFGTLIVGSGPMNIVQAFTNMGHIQLTAVNSNLFGGTITNNSAGAFTGAGTIEGIGLVTNVVNNSGTIESIGGTLSLSAQLSNLAGGLLSVDGGSKMFITDGLPTNAGIINLTGGTFDNGGRALNNTGQISGWGIFRTGGTGMDNNGSITFSGGITTVNGPVTNEGGHTITVAQNNAIFTGLVTNNANATFNAVNAVATFAGGFVNNGNSNFVKAGGGTVEIDAAPTLNNGSTLSVTTGTLRFNVISGAPTIGTGVTASVSSGATLELAGSVSALANGTNRVNIANNSTAPGVLVSGTNQQVGNIDGSGTTEVNAGSDLTANHIIQAALVIGGTSKNPGLVTIDASDASGNPLDSLVVPAATSSETRIPNGTSFSDSFSGDSNAASSAPLVSSTTAQKSAVPEPSSLILLVVGWLAVGGASVRRRRRQGP